MICHDWRDVSAETLLPLYAAERKRWGQHLVWDVGPTLRMIEQARAAGHVPGVLVRDAEGTAIGWAFYVLSHGSLQIGALTASSARAVRLMLDAIFRSPEAQVAQDLSCFLFPVSTSVTSALARQRFEIEPHHYLTAPLDGLIDGTGGGIAVAPSPAPSVFDVRPLVEEDGVRAVRLLARAYAGDATARCFAPHARLEEWAHYFGQLLAGPACGTLLPEASFTVEADTPSGLGAIVVTTQVSPGTAHLAQIAIDPTLRGRGLARSLVRRAAAAARDAGARRMSLLVADSNAPARALYAALGFVPGPAFLYGRRGPAPRRFADGRAGAASSLSDACSVDA